MHCRKPVHKDSQGQCQNPYRWWERNMPDSYLLKELDAMIDDSDRDNNYMLLPEVNAAAEE